MKQVLPIRDLKPGKWYVVKFRVSGAIAGKYRGRNADDHDMHDFYAQGFRNCDGEYDDPYGPSNHWNVEGCASCWECEDSAEAYAVLLSVLMGANNGND